MSLLRTWLPPALLVVAMAVVLYACIGDDPEAAPTTSFADAAGVADALAGPDVSPPPADAGPRKLVFATKDSFPGNFGVADGLGAADELCAKEASLADLRGTFRAWLSDGVRSPSNRFVKSTVPYTLVDGSRVARSFDELVASPVALARAINRDARGDEVLSIAFTGTAADGGPSAQHCNAWTDLDASTLVGGLGKTDSDWTEQEVVRCTLKARLICFEQ